MKKILFSMLIFMSFSLVSMSSFAQAPSSKNEAYSAKLTQFLNVSGGIESMNTMIKQIFAMAEQNAKGNAKAEKFFQEMKAKWTEKFSKKIIDAFVPVYQKYLTINDLNEMIKFYQTPVGKKLAHSTPLIAQDAMQIGQQVGMEMVGEIMQDMQNAK